MTDPTPTTPATADYIAAAGSAQTYESFGRAIASTILAASADQTKQLSVTAAAQPFAATHGQTCYTVSISIDGSYHYIQVCFAV